MSIMIKKHVNLPKWLNSYVKDLVQNGYFQNDAEALRAGLMIMAASLHDLSPHMDTLVFNEIARNIEIAKKEVEKHRISSAIERLRLASQLLTSRMVISAMDKDSDFFNSIRVVNVVFADCISSLAQIVEQKLDIKQIDEALKEVEIIENLEFLAETYQGLAKLKYQEREDTKIETDKFEPNYLCKPEK